MIFIICVECWSPECDANTIFRTFGMAFVHTHTMGNWPKSSLTIGNGNCSSGRLIKNQIHSIGCVCMSMYVVYFRDVYCLVRSFLVYSISFILSIQHSIANILRMLCVINSVHDKMPPRQNPLPARSHPPPPPPNGRSCSIRSFASCQHKYWIFLFRYELRFIIHNQSEWFGNGDADDDNKPKNKHCLFSFCYTSNHEQTFFSAFNTTTTTRNSNKVCIENVCEAVMGMGMGKQEKTTAGAFIKRIWNTYKYQT